LWINLPSQQRGCLEYRTVRGLFLVKLRDGRIQQRQDIVHPITRSALTNLRTGLRFAGLSLHLTRPPIEERYQRRKKMWIAHCSGQNLPQ
jgi:hypothetical protein